MKKFIVINMILAAMCSQYVTAQQAQHEFSAVGGLGLGTLRYNLSMGDRNGRLGGDIGFGYTYFRGNEKVTGTGRIVTEDWGLHTGIEFGFYNAKSTVSGNIVTKELKDSEDDQFDMVSALEKYKETQLMALLNIPMMAQFAFDRYYVLGGLKLGIPLASRHKAKNTEVNNKGWYEKYENWMDQELQSQGFGTFVRDTKGKLKYGVSAMLSLEGGVKIRLRRKLSIYSGVYFDYGLNNIAKNNKDVFINFNSKDPEHFKINSVLTANTDKVKVMAFGVKVRVAMVL